MKKHSKPQEMEWDSWFDRNIAQRVGLLPEIETMVIDWDKIHTELNTQASEKLLSLRKTALSKGMFAMFRELTTVRDLGGEAHQEFWRDYHALSKKSAQRIESKVSQLGTAITMAQVVRDTSADVFVVGATFMSGGTALGALAIGSAGKGVFKYQDTGNVGSALIETTGTFIFGAIPIGKAAAGVKAGVQATTQKYVVLVLAEAPLTVAQGLVEGKTMTESLIQGTVKVVADPLAGTLMKSKPIQKLLGKAAIRVTVKASGGVVDLLPKIVEGQVKKYGEKGLEKLLVSLTASKKNTERGTISLETDLFCRGSSAWRPIYNQAVQPLNSTAGATIQRIRGC